MKGIILKCRDLDQTFICVNCPARAALLNRFESPEWSGFWDRIANEWAENEKKDVYYGACFGGDCDLCIDAKYCLGDGDDDGEGDDW